jgi:hypothetical protein
MEKPQTNRASTIKNDPFAVLIPVPEEIHSREAPNIEPLAVSVERPTEPPSPEAKRAPMAKPVQGCQPRFGSEPETRVVPSDRASGGPRDWAHLVK